MTSLGPLRSSEAPELAIIREVDEATSCKIPIIMSSSTGKHTPRNRSARRHMISSTLRFLEGCLSASLHVDMRESSAFVHAVSAVTCSAMRGLKRCVPCAAREEGELLVAGEVCKVQGLRRLPLSLFSLLATSSNRKSSCSLLLLLHPNSRRDDAADCDLAASD